ncbi:MAG: hypothetical protein M3300_09555 [Actinomycetota bacterium]|nr:hypothetical protein [Actinomycetota bacterium]
MNSDAKNPPPPPGASPKPAPERIPDTETQLDPNLELRLLRIFQQWRDSDRTA